MGRVSDAGRLTPTASHLSPRSSSLYRYLAVQDQYREAIAANRGTGSMFVHPRTLLRNARAALHQRRLDKLLEADRAANRQQQLVQRRAEREVEKKRQRLVEEMSLLSKGALERTLEEEKRQKEVDAANKKGKKGKKGVLGKLRARNDAQQAALDQRAREAAARPAVVHMRGTEGQARKAAHQREL